MCDLYLVSALLKYDVLFPEIAREAIASQSISTSMIQKKYEIGFNRAGRIMMQLERAGIVGRQQGSKPREILISSEEQLNSRLAEIYNGNYKPYEYQETEQEIEERRREMLEREKQEIAAKIKEKYRRRELEKLVLQELIDSGELFGDQPKREPIPREIISTIYKRDGGRCVYCGSTQNLQIDHIIPFSKGGATTLENLQLLCQKCNLEKSNKI